MPAINYKHSSNPNTYEKEASCGIFMHTIFLKWLKKAGNQL